MQALEKRLSALEKTAVPDNRVTAVIRRIVRPGGLDAHAQFITAPGGQRWDRQDGETSEHLEERALREVVRNAAGFATIVTYQEKHDEQA